MSMKGVRIVEDESADEVRKDLVSMLKDELDVTEPGIMEEHSNEFLSDAGATVEESMDEIVIKWSVPPYMVEVLYEKPMGPVTLDGPGLGSDIVHDLDEEEMATLERDEQGQAVNDDNDDGDENDEEDDEDDEDDEDEYSSDEDDSEEVNFEVNLAAEGKKPVNLLCMAGMDNRLYVEKIYVEASPPINFDSLSEDVQDRMYDFLDSVKVDDRFGFFMRRRFYKTKRLGARETLTAFMDLLDHDNHIEEKSGKK